MKLLLQALCSDYIVVIYHSPLRLIFSFPELFLYLLNLRWDKKNVDDGQEKSLQYRKTNMNQF